MTPASTVVALKLSASWPAVTPLPTGAAAASCITVSSPAVWHASTIVARRRAGSVLRRARTVSRPLICIVRKGIVVAPLPLRSHEGVHTRMGNGITRSSPKQAGARMVAASHRVSVAVGDVRAVGHMRVMGSDCPVRLVGDGMMRGDTLVGDRSQYAWQVAPCRSLRIAYRKRPDTLQIPY